MAAKKKEDERVLGPGAYGDINDAGPDVESFVLDEDNHSHPVSEIHDTEGEQSKDKH